MTARPGPVQLSVLDGIGAVPAADFDRLDSAAGAAGSYYRTLQREADGRWHTRYLRRTDGGRLTALLPLHTVAGRRWPDPAYDPGGWPLPDGWRADYSPAGCLLVGSFADLRTGFPVAEELREPRALRELLALLARLAAAEDRCLVFPYTLPAARQALTAATGDRIGWASLGREARLPGIAEPDWLSTVRADVRRNLRRDPKLIAAAGIRASRHSWPEVEELASVLIAEHNTAQGRFDHAEFVKLRNREWDACPGLELTVFGARSATVTGFVTAFVWQDQLELYEIGLRGEKGPERLAAYLDLVFQQPIRLARATGLTGIRLGVATEQVKASRGAVLHELSGGVLSLPDVRRLAARAPSRF